MHVFVVVFDVIDDDVVVAEVDGSDDEGHDDVNGVVGVACNDE